MNAIVSPLPNKPRFSPWIAEEEIVAAMAQNRQKLTTFIDEVDPDYFNSGDCKNIFKMVI